MSLLLLFNQPSGGGGPVITAQPTDQSALVGGTATFSFTATGYSTAQWQTAAPIAFAQAAIIGTPANLTLSTSATPGAQSITVPADAEGVLFFWSAYAFDLSSLTSNFTDTFTLISTGNNGLADGVGVAYARVTSTGSKTVTPVWGGAQTNGPVFWTVFVKNIPTSGIWVRGVDTQHSPSDPSSALVGNVSSTTTDVVIAYDEQFQSTVPAAETGWTSLGTLTFNNYNARLSKADSPGASTTSFSGNGTAYPVMSLVSIISRPAGFGAWTNVSTGSGGTTSSWTTGTLSLSDDGYKVRALLDGSLSTNEVALTVTGGAVTHATTGALTGQIGTVAGTAAHIAVHGTTGALTGQIGTASGTAARFRAFSTTGVLTGQGSTIAGTAARATGAVTHATSGALTGPGSIAAGSATRFRAMATTGALTGQGSSLTGTAQRNATHATTGALAGQIGALSGAAARVTGPVLHGTSGALTGQGPTASGTAARFRAFTSSGALTGQIGSISGAASRATGAVTHSTSGALAGSGSALAGASVRSRAFGSSGSLIAQGAIISGQAARVGAPVTHSTSGALIGLGSTIQATAKNGEVPASYYGTGGAEGPEPDYTRKVLEKYEAIERARARDGIEELKERQLELEREQKDRERKERKDKIRAEAKARVLAKRKAEAEARELAKAKAKAEAEAKAKAEIEAKLQRAKDFPPLAMPHAGAAKAARDQSIEDDKIMELIVTMLLED